MPVQRLPERLLGWIGPVRIAGGLLLAASGISPDLQGMLQTQLRPPDDFVWSPFFAAVLGPTIASWGVLFTAIAREFLASPTSRLWNVLALSIAIWLPLDTGLYLWYGLVSGAVINAIVAATVIAVLIAVRRRIPGRTT